MNSNKNTSPLDAAIASPLAPFRCFIVGVSTLPIQCAELLRSHGHVICGIASSDPDVERWARDNNIPHSKMGPGVRDFLRSKSFDYLFSIINPQVLEPDVLALPEKFAVNYHDAPLPRYGGLHATSWAIMHREKAHGVTWHVMADRVDAGDILVQRIIPVAERETAFTLNGKCYDAAIESFGELVAMLECGTEVRQKQDPSQRTFFLKYRRPPSACLISWEQTAGEIDAFVRSLDFGLYPNALGVAKMALGEDFVIAKAVDVVERPSAVSPGTVTGIAADAVRIGTASGEVVLRNVLTLEGLPIPIPELVERYGIVEETHLPRLSTEIASRLTTYYEREARSERFWVNRLSGLRSPEFPYIHHQTRPGPADYAGVSIPVCDAVRTWLERLPPGCSRADYLTAAYCAYIMRLSGGSSFAIGYSDGDARRDVEGLEGIFAAHLPLSLEVDGEAGIEEIVAALRRERDGLKRHALYARDIVARYPALRHRAFHLPLHVGVSEDTSCYAPSEGCILALEIGEREDALRWHYDRTRISDDSLQYIAEQFATLLTALAEEPRCRISRLPLLTESERRRLLVEWNDTTAEYSRGRCIHEMFEEQAARTPDAVAVVFENEHLTYAQLNARANQLAHYLRRQGVGPESLVGLCMERSLEMVVCLLGILKAGGAYVPLDPAYPQERLTTMLEDSAAAVLLTQTRRREALPATRARVVFLDADLPAIRACSDQNPESGVLPTQLAYVIYTSGSTGRPKGVAIQHHSTVALLAWARCLYSAEELAGVLASTSICFDLSVYEIFFPLSYGGVVVVVENALSLLSKSEHRRITLINTVASAIVELLRNDAVPDTVLTINLAGEPLQTWLVDRIYEQTQVCRVYDLYGPSEDTTYSTFALREAHAPATIGRPITNTRLYILDTSAQPAPVGVAGELTIGGAGLARGYLNRPELTAEKFVPDPFSSEPGSRLYRTGDLARYFPDGNIEFLGRIDHQVKVRGFRIELGEIESVLLQHPGVQEAVVLAREDTPGDKRLVAYVAGSEGAVNARALREYLKEKLPEFMVPGSFVFLEMLPLSPNGKVDRKALPAPESGGKERETEYVGPRTPIEEGLADIWAALLRVERVGVCDNFFDLGGHSLLATQVISRIRNTFQAELPPHALFEAPTVAGLAQRIDEARGEPTDTAPPLVRISREQSVPLSFAQQRLWFIHKLDPQSPAYNIPIALRLMGPLNQSALGQSLQEIVRRHEALRTTFAVRDGDPVQIIGETEPLPLQIVDLGLPAGDKREAETRRLIEAEALRLFDLTRGPLFRSTLLRLEAEEHVLLLTMHHIVSDGWSLGVLTRELEALYNAFCAGKLSPLPKLSIQYADYTVWQRHWLEGEALEQQLAYWKEHLAGAPTLLELPTDRSRPPVQTFRGARRCLEIPTELMQEIWSLGQQEGATLFMTLLAAFQVLLSRYSGQEDIVVGTPIANRTRSELEGLIGFFVNTLALRSDLSGDPSFVELLGRVRETALEAYAHQDLPFEKLVEELQPERSPSYSPLFQVMFSFQNTPPMVPAMQGLRMEGVDSVGGTAKFDMLLEISEGQGGLSLGLEYNTDLFDAERIERLLGHYRTLLQGIAHDPDLPISRLPLLTKPERRQVLVDFNATAAQFPHEHSIHQLFEAQVERTPEAIAVEGQGRTLTYAKLHQQANQLAQHLRGLGVGPETSVGLCAQRSPEMMVGLLAILQAGAAYLPLDPDYPPQRVAFMLRDAAATLVLTHGQVADALADTHVPLLPLGQERTFPSEQECPLGPFSPACAAYVLYTSGSTGAPKGVVMSHHALVNLLLWQRQGLPHPARTLQFTSIGFDVSFQEIFSTWCTGGTLVLVSEEVRRDPSALLGYIEDTHIERLFVPFAILQHLGLAVAGGAQAPGALREIVTAGEQLQMTEELVGWLGREGAPILYNHYGPTEAHVVTAYELSGPASDWPLLPPIGRPIANTQMYVLDAGLEPVPVGVCGELTIGGAGVGRGYLNRGELTAERFVPDPFGGEAGARLYRTGDVGRWLGDGTLEYVGRVDHQVKIRGFRIELGEIESVLGQQAAVQEAVVLAREDTPGDKRLVAYVVSKDGSVSASGLRSCLRARLPGYMVPGAFVFVERLPLSSNGKVDRRALPAPEASGETGLEYVAARTPTEKWLAETWQSHLGISSIGIRDSFFEIGGHSLMAARIFDRIKKDLGKSLSPATLFQAPTIEALAAILDQKEWKSDWKCLVAIRPGGTTPPFFWIHHVAGDILYSENLIRYMPQDIPFYGVQSLGLDGRGEPLTRVEDMAELYLREIHSLQSNGPYYIGAYSLGCVIALEMAHRLHAQGEKVGLLAMLDPRCLVHSPHFPKRSYLFERKLIPWMFHAERHLLDLRRQGLKPYLRRQFEGVRKAANRRAGRLLRRFQPPQQPEGILRVWRLNLAAERAYNPRPYPGRITYFYSAERHPDNYGDPDTRLAWSDFAEGGLEVHLVPGHHGNMAREPYAKVLADKLSTCLKRAQEASQ